MSDLVRFAKAFLQNSSECPLFTQPDTLAEMLSPALTFSGTSIPRICHGLFSQRYGVTLIGHAGNTTGFSANLILDTQNGTGIVVMTNEVGETTYNYGLISLVYGDCKEETGFTYDDISGIYLNSRANYKSSFTKLYSMISGLLPISKGETEDSFTAAMVGTVTQISKDACIMDDGNGLKTYLSIQRDDNGNVVALQHMTGMDFQKENTILFAIKVIFFCLFVLSSLWMKEGQMLQNEQKNRGESGVWEVKKASEIKAWEFPRGHFIPMRCEWDLKDKASGFTALYFKHDEEFCRYIFNLNEGGKLIYPDNTDSIFLPALDKIRDTKVFSWKAFDVVYAHRREIPFPFREDYTEEMLIEELGDICIIENELVSSNEINDMNEKWCATCTNRKNCGMKINL